MQVDATQLHGSVMSLYKLSDNPILSDSMRESIEYAVEVLNNMSGDIIKPEGLHHWQIF
jgi:hypothetical protein